MVYRIADIKHLDLMATLAESPPIEADEVIIQQETRASLDENILKLCVGLRDKGLTSQAEALEQKFTTYKAANSARMAKLAANTHLYRAHDEDGEDLVNAAHPDGDVNMGDGEHGDVETIVSKHKKIVDVIQKTPTGKLGSYVDQCKIALGVKKKIAQDVSDEKLKEILTEGLTYASNIIQEVAQISAKSEKTEGDGIVKQTTLDDINNDLKDAFKIVNAGNLNYNKIMEITKIVDGIPDDLMSDGSSWISDKGNHYLAFDEDGQKLFDRVKEQIAIAKSRCNAAFQLLKGHVDGAKFQLQYGKPSQISIDGEQSKSQGNDFTTKAQGWLDTLRQWKTSIENNKDHFTAEDKQGANAWINENYVKINDLLADVKQSKIDTNAASQQLNEILKEFDEFKTNWVG